MNDRSEQHENSGGDPVTTDKAGKVALGERLERLREALASIRDGFDGDEFQDAADAYDQHREIARAALEKDENDR